MKGTLISILLFSIIIPLAIAPLIMVGCQSRVPNPNIQDECGGYVKVCITIVDGHKYIMAIARSGVSIIHAESCECKDRRMQ